MSAQKPTKFSQFKIFETGASFVAAEPGDDYIKPSGLHQLEKVGANYTISIEDAIKEGFPQDADTIIKECNVQLENMKKIKTLNMYPKIDDSKAIAITAYTLDLGKELYEHNVYRKINRTLAERSTNGIRALRGYLLHFLSALRSMPPVPNSKPLYRGIDGKYINWETHAVGHKLSWPAFTSTAIDVDTIEDFLEKSEKPVIFEIRGNYRGYSVKAFSKHFEEEEVILEPETVFVIKEIKDDTEISNAKRIVLEVVPSIPVIDSVVRNFNKVNHPDFDLELPPPSQAELDAQAEAARKAAAGSGTPASFLGSPGNAAGGMSLGAAAQPQQPQQPQQQSEAGGANAENGLPPNWVARFDPNTGRTYYANLVTHKTQWEVPKQTQPQQTQSQPQPQQQPQQQQYQPQPQQTQSQPQQQQQYQPQPQQYQPQYQQQQFQYGQQMGSQFYGQQQQQQPQYQQQQFQYGQQMNSQFYGQQQQQPQQAQSMFYGQQQQQQQQQPQQAQSMFFPGYNQQAQQQFFPQQQQQQQQQQMQLPLCPHPFTCTDKTLSHRNQFRHPCMKEFGQCIHAGDPDHVRINFHLIKQECTDPNCQLLCDPAHRFMFSHPRCASFIKPCPIGATCVYKDYESHKKECFHEPTTFTFPQSFNYQ